MIPKGAKSKWGTMKKKTKKKIAKKNQPDKKLLKSLARVPLFQGVPTKTLGQLILKSETETYLAGEYLFRAGQESDGPYVNLQGTLRIENNGVFISHVDEGESVGEMGVLNEWPRSADVLALRETKVLFIPKVHLKKLMQKDLKLALTLYKNAVSILGTLLRNKNIVIEFNKILDESAFGANSSEELNSLRPNVE